MDIFDNNKFNVLFDEFDNGNISSNDLYNKFVSIVYSIADDCDLTSTESIQKIMFHMSQKIFDLQKLKMKAYKDIKRLGSTQDLDNFMKLISKYVKLIDDLNEKQFKNAGSTSDSTPTPDTTESTTPNSSAAVIDDDDSSNASKIKIGSALLVTLVLTINFL